MSYTATLKTLGRTYTAKGETKEEAIGNLKPAVAKARGVLTVEREGKSKERVLNHVILQRLFNLSPTVRQVQLKQTAMLF